MKRSMLFTPANNAGNVMNAGALASDRIILDLEDSVSPLEKDAARMLAYYALKYMDYEKEVVVRINAITTPFWKDDISAVVPGLPQFLMVPKINCADDIRIIDEYVCEVEAKHGIEVGTVKLIALIETALGVENAFEIATSHARVSALFLGAADLSSDVHSVRTPKGEEIAYARSRVVYAARAAGIDAYDTPWPFIHDMEGAEADAMTAKQFGFTGKVAIYPAHAELFNRIFSPSQQEIEYAFGVIEALAEGEQQGKGVLTYNGEMIDAPSLLRAQQIVDMVNEMKGGRQA